MAIGLLWICAGVMLLVWGLGAAAREIRESGVAGLLFAWWPWSSDYPGSKRIGSGLLMLAGGAAWIWWTSRG